MILMTANTDYPCSPSYNLLSLSLGTWLPFEIRLYLYVCIVTLSLCGLLNALAAAFFQSSKTDIQYKVEVAEVLWFTLFTRLLKCHVTFVVTQWTPSNLLLQVIPLLHDS